MKETESTGNIDAVGKGKGRIEKNRRKQQIFHEEERKNKKKTSEIEK